MASRSRWLVGSSRMRASHSRASSAASATRFFCPPDSSIGRRVEHAAHAEARQHRFALPLLTIQAVAHRGAHGARRQHRELGQRADPSVAAAAHDARFGLAVAAHHREQRALAAAVETDDADAVAVAEREREIGEQGAIRAAMPAGLAHRSESRLRLRRARSRARSARDLADHFVGVLTEIRADVADSTGRTREPRHDAGHRNLESRRATCVAAPSPARGSADRSPCRARCRRGPPALRARRAAASSGSESNCRVHSEMRSSSSAAFEPRAAWVANRASTREVGARHRVAEATEHRVGVARDEHVAAVGGRIRARRARHRAANRRCDRGSRGRSRSPPSSTPSPPRRLRRSRRRPLGPCRSARARAARRAFRSRRRARRASRRDSRRSGPAAGRGRRSCGGCRRPPRRSIRSRPLAPAVRSDRTPTRARRSHPGSCGPRSRSRGRTRPGGPDGSSRR